MKGKFTYIKSEIAYRSGDDKECLGEDAEMVKKLEEKYGVILTKEEKVEKNVELVTGWQDEFFYRNFPFSRLLW